MPLISIFSVYLHSSISSIRKARFKLSAVHYSLFQFPTYFPFLLVLFGYIPIAIQP